MRSIILLAAIMTILNGLTTGLGAQTANPENKKGVAESAENICPIMVGEAVPDVLVKNLNGEKVALKDRIKEKPTILIFYRGGWCPYCNKHLAQLMEYEQKFINLGYQILAVSADRPDKLRASMNKHEMAYTLLSDNDLAAARAFGLAFRVSQATLNKYDEFGIDLEEASGHDHHWLPVPAAFVVSTDGTVRFSYINPNYKVRVNPEVLLTAAKEALIDGES